MSESLKALPLLLLAYVLPSWTGASWTSLGFAGLFIVFGIFKRFGNSETPNYIGLFHHLAVWLAGLFVMVEITLNTRIDILHGLYPLVMGLIFFYCRKNFVRKLLLWLPVCIAFGMFQAQIWEWAFLHFKNYLAVLHLLILGLYALLFLEEGNIWVRMQLKS